MGNGNWKIKLVCLALLSLYFAEVGVAMAAGKGHNEPHISSLLHPAVNFALYVALIVFIYKKYLRSEIKNASQSVADHMQRSLAQITEAEGEAAVVEKRKVRLEDEKAGIILQYKKEGEIQKERILVGAVEKSDAMVSGVLTQAERELAQAKIAVQKEVFRQVLADAGKRFENMPPEDDRKVRGGVMDSMLNNL